MSDSLNLTSVKSVLERAWEALRLPAVGETAPVIKPAMCYLSEAASLGNPTITSKHSKRTASAFRALALKFRDLR